MKTTERPLEERSILRIVARPSLHEKLDRARVLLGPRVRSGDPGDVIERALDEMIARLERRKRRPGRHSNDVRHVPQAVKDDVWQRDGGRCTYHSENGARCPARRNLEFDHIVAVAQGGRSMAANLRLRCRAHNQLTAERAFGAGFMDLKRREARQSREAAAADAAAREKAAVDEQEREIGPALRSLGFRKDQIRSASTVCALIRTAPLEERVRCALQSLAPVRGVVRISAP